MLTTIDFGIRTVGLRDVAAAVLDSIGPIEPALQVAAAKFPFLVWLIAGTLQALLDFDLVMKQLGDGLRLGIAAHGCDRNLAARQLCPVVGAGIRVPEQTSTGRREAETKPDQSRSYV